VNRREFITLLGGAAAWPVAASAQQTERMRSIGVLMSIAPDREGQARLAAFLQALQALGWTDGLNVRIETRWGAGNIETIRKFAAELVALGPDVILVSGGTGAGPGNVARDGATLPLGARALALGLLKPQLALA
jgi:putative tryptophan/tyrosine transport system substrate-binding protein